MNEVDNVLEHYGTKGMRWGFRKTESPLGTGSSHTVDSKVAKLYQEQARKHGVSSLSNDQLKELNKRMDLETKYQAWNKANPTLATRAKNFVASQLAKEVSMLALEKGKGSEIRLIGSTIRSAAAPGPGKHRAGVPTHKQS